MVDSQERIYLSRCFGLTMLIYNSLGNLIPDLEMRYPEMGKYLLLDVAVRYGAPSSYL